MTTIHLFPSPPDLVIVLLCFLLMVFLATIYTYLPRISFHQRRLLKNTVTSKEHTNSARPASTARKSTLSNYSKVFPPSRRSVVTNYLSHFHNIYTQTEHDDRSILAKKLLPTIHEGSSPLQPESSILDFTAQEIRDIGDLPQYDILTGVRLPEPYQDFNHTTALPRPYRPFRWGYQQNMGIFIIKSS